MIYYHLPGNILGRQTGLTKDRIKPKADWRAIDSPKKRTNEFDFFAVKSKKAKNPNLLVHFLGEYMARQSAYSFIQPLLQAE